MFFQTDLLGLGHRNGISETGMVFIFQQVFAINQLGEKKVEPRNNQHADDGASNHPTHGR